MIQHNPSSLLLGSDRPTGLAWIQVAPHAPYFKTDTGEPWLPVGQNDAITWPEFEGLFHRRDPAPAEAYVKMLAEHGVNCLRVMLEYCQWDHSLLEQPVGHFRPDLVRLWDDLFALCERYGLRILLTPVDTFWMWLRWDNHPYNQRNGGPCVRQSQWLLCPATRQAIKQRLAFAAERWGGSGALFAWDLWNEISPEHAEESSEAFADFIQDIGGFLEQTERRLYGRAHPQTTSVFGPRLSDPRVAENIFRHPQLDFANSHLYEAGTIDRPENTIDAAVAVARLTRAALSEIHDNRPFFDSEHGPISAFLDDNHILPEAFDDEYFRHIQWAHLASGGAGGGMRWPNRHPHSLTPGMRGAQRALANFLPLIDWLSFQRTNWNDEARIDPSGVHVFACGDGRQAIAYLLRYDTLRSDGHLDPDAAPRTVKLTMPTMQAGGYLVTCWNTRTGAVANRQLLWQRQTGPLRLNVPNLRTDLAIAVRRQP